VALSAEIVVVDGPEHDSSQALGADVTSLLNNESGCERSVSFFKSSVFIPTHVNGFHSKPTAVLIFKRRRLMATARISAQQNKQTKSEVTRAESEKDLHAFIGKENECSF
jgi:hypothetical protein